MRRIQRHVPRVPSSSLEFARARDKCANVSAENEALSAEKKAPSAEKKALSAENEALKVTIRRLEQKCAKNKATVAGLRSERAELLEMKKQFEEQALADRGRAGAGTHGAGEGRWRRALTKGARNLREQQTEYEHVERVAQECLAQKEHALSSSEGKLCKLERDWVASGVGYAPADGV